jgi:hypothetical protein
MDGGGELKYPSFRVGAAFPADERSAALMQLLLATRQWMSIQRALLQELPEGARAEHFLHLVLLAAGAAKEAADAFRSCDQLRWFEAPAELRQHLSTHLALARAECSDVDQGSLFKAVLVRLRNNTGFHWSRALLEQALASLAGQDIEAGSGGALNFDSSVPLALVLASRVLASQGVPEEQVPEVFPRIINLLQALYQISHSTVACAVIPTLDSGPS